MPGTGDFAVVRTGGWFAKVIRFMTKSQYNHAFTYVGNDQITEANPSGYAYGQLSEYDGHEQLWSTGAIKLTAAQRDTITTEARALTQTRNGRGTPYSFLDIVALFLAITTHIATPRWVERRLARPDRMICSQAVDYLEQQAGIRLFNNVEPGEVTPGMLAEAIRQHQTRPASGEHANAETHATTTPTTATTS